MPTALVFSRIGSRSDRWAHALEDYGWDALETRRLDDLAVSHRVRCELAVVDIETHADLVALSALGRRVDLPPAVVRVSPLAQTIDHATDLPGTWRASVHVGHLTQRDLIRAVTRLHQASLTATTLPVRLPLVPVTKWSVRLRGLVGRIRAA